MRGKEEENCDPETELWTTRIFQFSGKNEVAEPASGRGWLLSLLDAVRHLLMMEMPCVFINQILIQGRCHFT